MKANECDRCGEFYKDDVKSSEHNLRLLHNSTSKTRYAKPVDLCPICQESLNKWFEEGKKDE
jgi:hypothetical protein